MDRWVEHPPTAPSSCLIQAHAALLQAWSLPGPDLHLPAEACMPLTPPRHRRCPSMEVIQEGSKGSNGPSIQRVFQYSSTVLVECPDTPTSLCSTPLDHHSAAPPHPLTLLVECPSWASTPLDPTTRHSSPQEQASPTLHSIISQSHSMVKAACHQEDTMPSPRQQ